MDWVRIAVVGVSSGLAVGLVELLFRGKPGRHSYRHRAHRCLSRRITHVLVYRQRGHRCRLVMPPAYPSRWLECDFTHSFCSCSRSFSSDLPHRTTTTPTHPPRASFQGDCCCCPSPSRTSPSTSGRD